MAVCRLGTAQPNRMWWRNNHELLLQRSLVTPIERRKEITVSFNLTLFYIQMYFVKDFLRSFSGLPPFAAPPPARAMPGFTLHPGGPIPAWRQGGVLTRIQKF
jgi:hypothetical protein